MNKCILRILVADVIIFLCIMIMTGCSSEVNKLQKAENRVLANIESVKRIRAITADIFPCSNDTVVKSIHDTTTNTLIKTVKHIDTLVKDGTKFIFHTDTAFFEKTKTVYETKVVTDKELTNRQKDSLIALHLQIAAQNGAIDEVRTNISDARKASNKWEFYFWLLLVGAILSHVVRSYIPKVFSKL